MLATIITALIVAALAALCVRSLVSGKSSGCAGNCAGCAGNCQGHAAVGK